MKNKILISFFLLATFLSFSGKAEAAVLYMRPSQANVSVGNIINVQVSVDTGGKVINNTESTIQFPSDLLEIVSIDKTSSIFSLWVEEPSFSNRTGRATFNGGVPNPGYSGSSGKVVAITFRAIKAGTASILFSDSAIRENDGLGTDILSGKSGSEINITATPAPLPVVPVVPVAPAAAPVSDSVLAVTSSSHPNQNIWYKAEDIDLSWSLPKNAVAVKTLLSPNKDAEPTVYFNSPIISRSINDVEDGVWYFHINYLAGGVWSKAQHYRLQIDTVPPSSLSVNSEKDSTGNVILQMQAEDARSGLDYYKVVVDSDNPITVKPGPGGEATLEVPFYRSGEHKVIVSAFDRAGNKADMETKITTDYALDLRIDSYPAKISVDRSIEISGTAPRPYSALRVSLENSDHVVQTYKIKSDSYSKFNFVSQPISAGGSYELWVDMLDGNGDVSLSSQKVQIYVETPLLLQIGTYKIALMKVLIPAAILLIVLLLALIYSWFKFSHLYRRTRYGSHEVERIIEKSFRILRKDLRQRITKLKKTQSKRKLTTEEINFLEQFEEELSEAEDVIEKELNDISGA